MIYNLLIDTEFKDIENSWELINCTYENGKLISNKSVFGIKQKLFLKDVEKVYFRVLYTSLTRIKRAVVGIARDNELYINEEYPRQNKERFLSVVESVDSEIEVHVIFESIHDINEVKIRRPLLVDITSQKYQVKYNLDKKLDYRVGHFYNNEYKSTPEIVDAVDIEEHPKGTIIKTLGKTIVDLNHAFEKGQNYLVKCSLTSLNEFGSISLRSTLTSGQHTKEQSYLIFKAVEKDKVQLTITNPSKLESIISLENILIVNLTKQPLKLKERDIERLPYC